MQRKYIYIFLLSFIMITIAFIAFLFSQNGDRLLGNQESTSNSSSEHADKPIQTEIKLVKDDLPLVIIDPGHGGEETGAVGWNTGIAEKDITLAIATHAKEQLASKGVQVLLTRVGDWMLDATDKKDDLLARAYLAEKIGGDLFISIHADQFDRIVRGSKVFYSEQNPCTKTSNQLAERVYDSFISATESYPLGVHMEDFIVLRENTVPAVLIETGFVSQKEEEQLLVDPAYQKKAGEAIAQGIYSYLKEMWEEKAPVTGCEE